MIQKNNCTACGACLNTCPKNAVLMKEDKYNFLFPQIDNEKCIHCGLCDKVCKNITTISKNKYQNSYAIQSESWDLLKKSSSGGMFAQLAGYVLSQNGAVFGCTIERIEDGFDVKHIYIENKNDLYKLQGSKYVQSRIGNTFKQAKEFLEQGRLVLFSGTPCQIAGLKAFLNNKKYNNLLTVDLSCEGTPSLQLFNDYIKFLENKYNIKIEDFKFRSKKHFGWSTTGFVAIYHQNNKLKEKILLQNISSYFHCFINGYILQECCYNCKYAGIERISDITLADAWGIEQEYPELLKSKFIKNKGISLVLINTNKGELFFNKIKENVIFEKINMNKLRKYNHPLKHPSIKNELREKYLEEYKINSYEGFDRLFRKNLGKKFYYYIIKNHTPQFIKNIIKMFIYKQKLDCLLMTWSHLKNYGAILTAYALKKTINDLGFSVKIIKFTEEDKYIAKPFNKKHCVYTEKKYLSTNDFRKLAKVTNTYIVGSDNQFNINVCHKGLYLSLGAFLPKSIKKVSISTSMSLEKINAPEIEISTMKTLLKRFDYLSVREYNSVDIMKETFDCEADWVIDPVFYLNRQEYIELAKESNIDAKNKILQYVLYPTKETGKILNKVKVKYGNNFDFIDFAGNEVSIKSIKNKFIKVEDWLKAIIDSKLIVTDSFHGICFAIMFNKPFVCIKNNHAFIRFKSLFKMFELENIVTETSDNIIYNENYDFQKIQNIIQERSNFVKNKLIKILTEPRIITKKQEEAEVALQKIQKKELYAKLWYRENKFFYYGIIVPIVKPILKIIREHKCKK